MFFFYETLSRFARNKSARCVRFRSLSTYLTDILQVTLVFPGLVCYKASDVSIAKNQLQLAGITSVYVASKVVECLPLNVDTCVMYTDYSVTKVCFVIWQTF